MSYAEPGGGGGDYVAIDPQLLSSMIKSMQSSTGESLTLVNGYISRFGEYGLDTSSLSKAVQDLNWANDQVPMLNRRQSLAQAMEQQNPDMGPMVPGGAGTLDFATNSAASAAGKSDGQKALQALQDHSNDDFILSELQQYGDDPAYLAAFFQSLGGQGLTALGLQTVGYQQEGQKGQYTDWSTTVGQAFATATYSMPYKDSWLGSLQLPNDISADPAIPQLGLIQPFLEHGVYSSNWLSPLGQYALQTAYTSVMPGSAYPIPLDGIWTAMSNNPAFAAKFYNENFAKNTDGNPNTSISSMMSNPELVGTLGDSAFSGFVKAANIPPVGTTGSAANPYATNAQLTVRYFGEDSGVSLSGSERAAFGAITENYFNDMTSVIRSAAPGVGGQDNFPGLSVSASESDWKNFVTEAMGDKTTAAQLMTFYSGWYAQNNPQDDRGSGTERVPGEQGFWNNASLGMVNNFIAQSYKDAGSKAGDSSDAIAEIAKAGGAAFLTSLVFGPEAGIAAALLDGGKDAFQTAVEGAFPDGPKPTPSGSEALSQLTGVQTQWANTVNLWYNGPPGSNEGAPPIDKVTYLGQPYTGDPTYYQKKFGGTFINGQGQVESMQQIQSNPKALAAYNAWLQDPAIVNANESKFSSTGIGELLSQYANSYSGGGG
jgi:hypothetical protein